MLGLVARCLDGRSSNGCVISIISYIITYIFLAKHYLWQYTSNTAAGPEEPHNCEAWGAAHLTEPGASPRLKYQVAIRGFRRCDLGLQCGPSLP